MKNCILLGCILLMSNMVNSQMPDSLVFQYPQELKEFEQRLHEYYHIIPESEITTNYFFNKGFNSHTYLNRAYREEPILHNAWSFSWLVEQINDSKKEDHIEEFVFSRTGEFNDTIDISLLDIHGNILDSLFLLDYTVPLTSSDLGILNYNLDSINLFSGALNKCKTSVSENIFRFNPDRCLIDSANNENYYIDFGDGTGYKLLNTTTGNLFNIDFNSVGKKSVSIMAQDHDGITKKAYLSFSVTALESTSESDIVIYSDEVPEQFRNQDVNREEIVVPGGEAELYISGVLDKPIIVSQGYDFEQTGQGIAGSWLNRPHIKELREDFGYDLIAIKYYDTTRSIFSNAQTLKSLIQNINNQKIGNHGGVYIGHSMGGLIGRIALKQMENSGIDHEIDLYTPYDSPLNGAHIPLSAQQLTKMIFEGLDEGSDFLNFAWDIAGYFVDEIEYLENLAEDLNRPSIKQMLRHHVDNIETYDNNSPVSAIGHFQDFQQTFNQIGYPSTRNVAIVNGSVSGNLNSVSYGAAYINQEFTGESPLWGFFYNYDIQVVAFYARDPHNWSFFWNLGPTAGFSADISHWCPGAWPWQWFNQCTDLDVDWLTFRLYTDPLMDPKAPGGLVEEHGLEFCLVPTLSALDFNDQYLPEGIGWQQNVYNKADHIHKTPLDDYFGNSNNSTHVSPINIGTYVRNEIMAESRFMQNQTINRDRDYEADNITLGSNVTPNNWNKLIQEGEILIKEGTNANFRGRSNNSTISLKKGVRIENGANVSFKIDYDSNPIQNREEVLAIPTPPSIRFKSFMQVGDTLVAYFDPEMGSVSWQIDGITFNSNQSEELLIIPELSIDQHEITCILSGEYGEARRTASVIIISP